MTLARSRLRALCAATAAAVLAAIPGAHAFAADPLSPGAAGREDATPAGQGEGGASRPPATPEEAAIARHEFEEGVRILTDGDRAGASATFRYQVAAAEAFERAYDADPDLVHAGVNAGLVRERLGDDAAALALYARVLEENPGAFPAARNLVRLRLRKGEAAAAERDLRERLARWPSSAALHVALAEALLAADRVDEAEQEARKALKLEEKSVPAMVALASAYHRKARHELAKMVLENARQVDDRDPAVWNRLAFVELALGNRAQALEDFKAAAALGPEYAEAHANYGAFLADAEDFQGAVAELELAVKYAPQSAAAWLDLGNAYRGTQQFEKAEEAYRQAAERDPKLVEVQYNLALLYLDGEKPGLPALDRLERSLGFFDGYERAGGADPRLADYRRDAAKAIDREKKRLAREERDRLRKEAEAKKKEDEARKEAEAAAQKAAEEEAKRAEAEAKRAAEEVARAEQAAKAAAAEEAARLATPQPAPVAATEKQPAAAETAVTATATATATDGATVVPIPAATAPPAATPAATATATPAPTPTPTAPPTSPETTAPAPDATAPPATAPADPPTAKKGEERGDT